MRCYVYFLLSIIISSFIAYFIVSDPGYVLISYRTVHFETTLFGTLLLCVILFTCIVLLASLRRLLISIVNSFFPFSNNALKKRTQDASIKGLISLSQGRWKQAEKQLSIAIQSHAPSIINYLAIASSANEQGDYENAIRYLSVAEQKVNHSYHLAISIAQAQLLLSNGRFEQALATLEKLKKKNPQHTFILKLLMRTYLKLGDWKTLIKILPSLSKKNILNNEQYLKMEQDAYNSIFSNLNRNLSDPSLNKQLSNIDKLWESLTSTQRNDPAMIYRYAKGLTILGAEKKAEQLLHDKLSRHYSSELINLYGIINGQDTHKQLITAENLLNQRSNDAELLLALGRISFKNKLYGKSREYLEASLRLKKSVETYEQLGYLFAHIQDFQKGTEYFIKGARLSKNNPLNQESNTRPSTMNF